jgi:hypothetical protein
MVYKEFMRVMSRRHDGFLNWRLLCDRRCAACDKVLPGHGYKTKNAGLRLLKMNADYMIQRLEIGIQFQLE